MSKPDAFSAELWCYADPKERPTVKDRFESFKSREYLDECIETVIKELDIEDRDEDFTLSWKPKEEKEKWSQKNVLMAQALVNIDIFFFPDPDKIQMAKDVVAEVVTIDDRPFKCKARKLSIVQQAFLTAKTNIMLRMGQLKESKSDWCHGLVLVAYEDRINKFMEKHGDEAMEKLFLK